MIEAIRVQPSRTWIQETFGLATLIFVCFPFILPIVRSDLQPIGLIFGSIFIAYNEFSQIQKGKLQITGPMLLFAFVVIYAFFVSWATEGYSFRGLGNYISVFVFCYAGYHLSKNPGRLLNLLILASVIWLFVGIVQYFFDPKFLLKILSRISTSLDRGVVSLAPEPSIYGIQCLLMASVAYILGGQRQFKRRATLVKWILLMQVFLLARSTMAIGLAMVFIGVSGLGSRSWKSNFMTFSLIGLLLTIFIKIQNEGDRLPKLINGLLENPINLILADQSINQRFADIVISFFSFFHEFPLSFGHGTSQWNAFFNFYINDFSYLWFYNPDATRIMSGYGAAIFELGWLGFFFPLLTLWSFLMTGKREFYVVGFFLSITMISSVPLATPLFGFLLGLAERERISRRMYANEDT